MTPEFRAFPKIPRLNRDITITEKIDGTNACVVVTEDHGVYAQSRKRIITPADDNFGFAAWVYQNTPELQDLGPGHHFGEWYGSGIQRKYGLDHKRFALFNPDTENVPACCDVVPVLYRGTAEHLNAVVRNWLRWLERDGSYVPAALGFDRPEGIVVYHHAAHQTFKVLLEGDDVPKGLAS